MLVTRPVLRCLVALAFASSLAHAQIANPADTQQPPKSEEQLQAERETQQRLRSWEMPPTVVTAERLGELREEDLIGSYAQPRWTATRRFPTTRVYVIPEGQFELEYWSRIKVPDSGSSTVETQYEFEMGLPHRFQLDFYMVTEKSGSNGTIDISEQKYEARYALADWGEIWGNPTLYFEWVSVSGGPDKIEPKILLGGEIAPSWHWGTNFVFEHEVSGARESEYELTVGVSKTLQDEKLSLGGEMKAALVDDAADRGDYTQSLEIGPSLQYRPVPAMHLDVAPLIGIGSDSRDADIYFVLGWEF